MSDKNNLQVEVHVDVSQPENQIDNLKGSVTDFLREILPEFDTAGSKLLGFVKNIYTAKNSIANVSDEATDFFKKYENNGKDLTKSVSNSLAQTGGFDSFVNSSKLADKSLISFLKNADYGTKNLANYQKYLNETGKKTSLFSSFTKSAGNVLKNFGSNILSKGVGSLIDIGIDTIINGLTSLAYKQEISAEKAKEFTESINEFQASISQDSKQIGILSGRYAELSKGVSNAGYNVSLTNDEYTEYKNIVNELKTLIPDLNILFNDQGEAIGFAEGKLKNFDTRYKQSLKIQAQKTLSEGDEEGNTFDDALDDFKNSNETNTYGWSNIWRDSIGTLLQGISLYAPISEIQEGVDNSYGSIDWGSELFGATAEYSEQEQVDVLEKLKDAKKDEWQKILDDSNWGDSKEANLVEELLDIDVDEVKNKSEADFKNIQELLLRKITSLKQQLDIKANSITKGMFQILLTDDDYMDIKDENTKSAIATLINGLNNDALKAIGIDTKDQNAVETWVVSLIDTIIANKNGVGDAIRSLFTLDTDSLTPLEAKKQVDNYITTIAKTLYNGKAEPKQVDNLKKQYGFSHIDEEAKAYSKKLSHFYSTKRGNNSQQTIEEWSQNNRVTKNELDQLTQNGYNATTSIDVLTDALTKNRENEQKKSIKPFQKIWDTLDTTGNSDADKKATEEKEKLLQLAEKGKLTVNEFKKSSIAGTILDGTKLSEEEATLEINNLVEDVKQLETMRTGIRAITSVYSEKKNSEKNLVSPSTLNSLENTIDVDSWKDKDKKVWENYKSVAGDDSRSLTDLKRAQDELASSYVNSNNFLSNLKETNKDYYEGLLKEMGVINAHEIVTERLENEQKNLSIVKKELGIKASDFKNATVSEIAALYDVKSASKKASTAMYNLLSSKIKSGQVTIKTAADCQNLINMANAAGIATHKIKNLQNAEMKFSRAERLEKEADGLQATINAAPDGKEIEYVKQTGQIVKFSSKTSAAARIANYRRLSKENKDEAEKDVAKWYKKNYKKIKLSDANPKDDGKGDENKYKNTKQQFDWIERRVNRLTSSINLLNAKKENLFSVKKKNSNLNKQIKETTKLINTYSSAIKKYDKKADSVKIFKDKKKDKNIKKLIRNGKIQIKDYDEGTAKKIQDYQNWYDKSKSAEQSLANTKKQKRELKKEKYQNSVDLFNARVSRAEAKEAIGIGYKDKNKSVDTQIRNAKKSYDYQIKIAKLENNRAEWKKLEYEREKKIAELRLQQINNVQQDYENRIGLIENERENIENAISLAEAKGKIVTAGYYKKQNDYTNDKRAKAVEEKRQIQISLDQALKNKEIEEGSDEWYEVQSKLHTLDNTINECDVTIANNTRAIREVHKTMLDEMAENKNRINTEADFIAGLMSRKEMINSDTGTFTREGLGTLGAYGIKMETAQDQIRELNEERAILEDMKKKGILDFGDGGEHKYDSLEDFEKYYNELIQKQQEWVKTEYDAEQGIIDKMKEYYQAQLDYMKNIIEAKKKALNIEKDLYDYQKNIAEKTKNIALLEKQAAAIKGDTSEEGRARLAKIQLSLDDAKQDLQDTEYDKYISDQQNMLDNMSAEYEDLMQRLFKDTDALLSDGIAAINENGAVIKSIMDKTAEDYNYDYSGNFSEIMTAFNANQPIVTGIKASLNGDESSIASVLSRQDENIAAIYNDVTTIAGGSGSGNKSGNQGDNGDTSPSIKHENTYTGNGVINNTASRYDGTTKTESNIQNLIENAVKSHTGMGTSDYWTKKDKPKHKVNQTIQNEKWNSGKVLTEKGGYTLYNDLVIRGVIKGKANTLNKKGKNTVSAKDMWKALDAAFTSAGFQTGGIVRANNVPLTGDYVPVRVNPNETILTQKFTDMLPQTVDVMDNLQKAILVPDYTRQIVKNDVGTSYGDIHFDIDLPNVTNSSTAKDIIHALQNDTKVQQVFSEGVNNLMKQRRITGRTRSIR